MDDENQLLANELTKNLATLVGGRDDALREFGKTQVALYSVLRQEAVRQRRRGREDRARALEARADASLAVIERLEIERQRLRIVVPDVSEKQILIHGRVRDPASSGLTGLTVCLVDSKNQALPGIPSSATDESGYYAFALSPPERTDRLPTFLAIFSPTGRLIHQGKKPLELAAGARLAVDVTLDPRELHGRIGEKHVRRQKRRGATGIVTGTKRKGFDAILGAITKDRQFSEIGISADELAQGLAALGIDSVKDLAGLAGREEGDLRGALRLPNVEGARVLKRIIRKSARIR
jgi:hypothetical protein